MKPGYPVGHEFLTREIDDLVRDLTGVNPSRIAAAERRLGFVHVDGDGETDSGAPLRPGQTAGSAPRPSTHAVPRS